MVLLFLVCIFFLAIVVGLFASVRILSGVEGSPRLLKEIGPPLAVCALAAGLLFSVPRIHHVFYDDFNYLSQATNIFHSGRPLMTRKGSGLVPEDLATTIRQPGFAVLAVFGEAMTGDVQRGAFLLNMLLAVIAVAAFYRIVRWLDQDRRLALLAAFFLAMLPVYIKYSTGASADTSGLAFFLLSVMFLGDWHRRRANLFFYAALFTGAFSASIKPVYFLFTVAALSAAMATFPRRSKDAAWGGLTMDVLLLLVPMGLLLGIMAWREISFVQQGYFSLKWLPENMWLNSRYLFNPAQSVACVTVLSLIGAWHAALRKDSLPDKLMLAWFLLGFLMISGYYAGAMHHNRSTDSERYFLLIACPFAVLAARGALVIVEKFRWQTAGMVSLGLVCLAFSWQTIQVGTRFTLRRPIYRDMVVIQQILPSLPEDAYVMHESAPLLSIMGAKKVISADMFLKGDQPQKIADIRGIKWHVHPEMRTEVNALIEKKYRCTAEGRTGLSGTRGEVTVDICEKAQAVP